MFSTEGARHVVDGALSDVENLGSGVDLRGQLVDSGIVSQYGEVWLVLFQLMAAQGLSNPVRESLSRLVEWNVTTLELDVVTEREPDVLVVPTLADSACGWSGGFGGDHASAPGNGDSFVGGVSGAVGGAWTCWGGGVSRKSAGQ